ncbi:MaoC/PaaZ C-terminal domain-containing protein [Desulfobacter curvatus]|uniref:MaoC/PaaZ C-terminal domain-containing protein n=1 Tax=Desulfobacter curvatus TaxID=2290 RepID=UPI0003699FF5|nr:MaoC/PaaZ C-terminal domain-containing protein [Desulfobacter curvatus]
MTQETVFRPSGRERVIVMNTPPSIPGLFARMIFLSMVRPITPAPDTILEKACVVYPNVPIDPDKVNRFKQVCGYDMGRAGVPAAFIQSLFIGMMSRFISASCFPISPMGLIQTGQSFDLIQPVSPGQKMDLYCRILDMTRTEKGITSRFLMEAAMAEDNPATKAFSKPEEKELVWQGTATYFTRSKTRKSKGKKPPPQEIPLPVREIIEVPGNTGRCYADVSRDFNPHHLYTWTARLMGFKHPIAHGIWSMARAGASLEKAAGYPKLTGMNGALKLPIFMPAQITLGYTFSGTNALFELRDKAKGVPHLKGSFRFSPTDI